MFSHFSYHWQWRVTSAYKLCVSAAFEEDLKWEALRHEGGHGFPFFKSEGPRWQHSLGSGLAIFLN